MNTYIFKFANVPYEAAGFVDGATSGIIVTFEEHPYKVEYPPEFSHGGTFYPDIPARFTIEVKPEKTYKLLPDFFVVTKKGKGRLQVTRFTREQCLEAVEAWRKTTGKLPNLSDQEVAEITEKLRNPQPWDEFRIWNITKGCEDFLKNFLYQEKYPWGELGLAADISEEEFNKKLEVWRLYEVSPNEWPEFVRMVNLCKERYPESVDQFVEEAISGFGGDIMPRYFGDPVPNYRRYRFLRDWFSEDAENGLDLAAESLQILSNIYRYLDGEDDEDSLIENLYAFGRLFVGNW